LLLLEAGAGVEGTLKSILPWNSFQPGYRYLSRSMPGAGVRMQPDKHALSQLLLSVWRHPMRRAGDIGKPSFRALGLLRRLSVIANGTALFIVHMDPCVRHLAVDPVSKLLDGPWFLWRCCP